MGVVAHPLFSKQWKVSECSTIPLHLRGLFQEFLRRYDEWHCLRRMEAGGLVRVVFVGFLSLFSFMWIEFIPEFFTFGLLLLFISLLQRYYNLKRETNHAYVNVHILYHHLLGKIEVGFCEHEKDCQCVENFKKYVWNEYHISLYGNSI